MPVQRVRHGDLHYSTQIFGVKLSWCLKMAIQMGWKDPDLLHLGEQKNYDLVF